MLNKLKLHTKESNCLTYHYNNNEMSTHMNGSQLYFSIILGHSLLSLATEPLDKPSVQ